MRGIVATCAGIGGVAVGLWLMAGPARALTPSADAGAELAARWCAGCHVVAPSGAGTDSAPSFLTLARSRTADQLRLFLAKPHARPMRGFSLSNREIEDMIAYFDTLEQGASR